jgi:hypothetical protein
MHPILHAWIILHSMPNFRVRLFAWYIVGGKQLSTRRMNLCRREKSSSKNLLGEPWVDAPPSSLCDPKRVQRVGFAEMVKNLVPLPASSTKRGRGVVLEAPGLD